MQQSNIIISGIRKKTQIRIGIGTIYFVLLVCVCVVPFSLYVFTACWANLILELWAMPIVQPKYRLQSDEGVLQPRSELLYIPPPISSAAPHFFTTPYAQKLAIKCTTNGIRNAVFEICFIPQRSSGGQ